MITVSIWLASMPAWPSACRTAIVARSVALSSSAACRRSLIPVSRTISSSERCGKAFRISLLARMVAGAACPTPAMQTVSALVLNQQE